MFPSIGFSHTKDLKRITIRLFVIAGDALAVWLAYAIAYLVRFFSESFVSHIPVIKGIPEPSIYLKAAPVIIFMWFLALYWEDAYKRIQMPALDEGIRVLRATMVGTLLSMSAMFLYRESSFSRVVFVLGGFFGFFLVYLFRQLIKTGYVVWVQRNKRPRKVLVVGKGRLALSLKRILENHGDRAILTTSNAGLPHLQRTILRSRINELLVAHPDMDHKSIVKLATFCETNNVQFRLIPDILEIRMGEVLIDESFGLPMFQIRPVSLQGMSFLTKRIMDVTLAGVLAGVFFLPLVFIAFLIKISSPGPVFYSHKRVGYREKPFHFMKFRTMVSNADDLLERLKEKSDRKGPVFKMKKDPRITPFGKFLRRYSLDEVPQIINVIRGDMSLVGPRPQVEWEAKNYDEWAKKRLNVLPGITGLWQVSGRAELTYEEMIDLDIFYIEHWSPGLDIKILLKTIPAVLSAKGAY